MNRTRVKRRDRRSGPDAQQAKRPQGATPSPAGPPSSRELFALALVAASVIATEILLTRIFSFITWHHYTPLIIGIALLGFGFAGSYLSVTGGVASLRGRKPFLVRMEREALALAVALPLALIVISRVPFNPSRIFEDWTQLLWILVYLVAVAIPFSAAGLVICRMIDRYRDHAGRVYGTDLAASAAGVLVGLGLLGLAGAEAAVLMIALIAAGGAHLLAREHGSGLRWSLAALAILGGLFGLTLLVPPGLFHPPPSKEMAVFKSDPFLRQVPFEVSRWHPIARVDVTAAMTGRAPDFGGELSPRLREIAGEQSCRYLFQDGTAPSAFLKLSPPLEAVPILRGYLQSVPYKIRPEARTLVIGVGGGVDVAIALAHGAVSVTGVEVNPVTLRLLADEFDSYVGGLASDRRVTLVNGEGRAFARSSRATYDVVQLSGTDTFAALVSGSGSLAEGYLYTVEAIEDFLARLAPDGVLSYSRPYFTPPRETLKLVATADRALRARGVPHPSAHIIVIAGKRWAETLISPSPFSPSDIATLETFAAELGFYVFATPSTDLDMPWDRYLALDEAAADTFRREYFFNVEPATDDRPFFYNYARWSRLLSNRDLPVNIGLEGYHTAESPLGPLPVGNVLLLVTLVAVFILAAVLIVFPLRARATALAAKPLLSARVLAYFAALGLAFITVEIALIQHFQLLLGSPTAALAVVLFSLLGGAGLGSLLADRLLPQRLTVIVPLIALLIVADLVLLPMVTGLLAGAPLAARTVIGVLLIALLGLVMGMPFPLGIRLVAGRGRALVPWAWAANGFFSVFGSVLCIFVAMSTGFNAVMGGAAAIYVLGFLALRPELDHQS